LPGEEGELPALDAKPLPTARPAPPKPHLIKSLRFIITLLKNEIKEFVPFGQQARYFFLLCAPASGKPAKVLIENLILLFFLSFCLH
jgi:hypothetical protein